MKTGLRFRLQPSDLWDENLTGLWDDLRGGRAVESAGVGPLQTGADKIIELEDDLRAARRVIAALTVQCGQNLGDGVFELTVDDASIAMVQGRWPEMVLTEQPNGGRGCFLVVRV
jgi:hypothetical protein